MTTVCGIVLGAGSSRRLGRPKQTLRLGDTTLLGRVVADVETSGLDRVIVVVNEAEGVARAGLDTLRAEVVFNSAFASGCASTLLAGLDAAGECDAVMLLLGDMPGVDASIIDLACADWDRHRPWASVTTYRGQPGHPFMFSADAFPTLRNLHGDKAVWKILDAQPTASGTSRSTARSRPMSTRGTTTWPCAGPSASSR